MLLRLPFHMLKHCMHTLGTDRLDRGMSDSAVHSQGGYRPDIDGMRAIAVLSVLFYHMGISQLSGGYVGVDIFLVISGYLISGILFAEFARTGHISFLDFYYRRLKRIAPALIATIVITSLFVGWLYSPTLLAAYGQSAWMAIVSVSNIGFYLTSGYFDTDSAVKPLLHTWSLSVEEQFYVIWPLLIAFLVRSPRFVFPAIALIAGASLVASQWQVVYDSDAAYFLMPFRVFEFAIGALLHAVPVQQHKYRQLLQEAAVLVGISGIVYSVLTYTTQTPFPGLAAVLPCLSTGLLIWGKDAQIGRYVLGNRWMVWIGKLSYSLYLVHWPIIVLYDRYRMIYQYKTGKLTTEEQLGVLVAVCVTAYLLHVLIEVPQRRPSADKRKFAVRTLLWMGVIAVLGVGMTFDKGLVSRPWIQDLSVTHPTFLRWRADRLAKISQDCNVIPTRACVIQEGKRNALVIGNSHVIDGWNILRTIYPADYFFVLDTNGCAITVGKPNTARCSDSANLRFNEGFLRQFDYIVYSRLVNAEYLDENLEYLSFLHAQKVTKVVVLGNYYRSVLSFDDALQMFGNDEQQLRNFLTIEKSVDQAFSVASKSHGFLFVDKFAALCDNNVCPIFTPDAIPFTYDKHHLTYAFAVYIAERTLPEIRAYLDPVPAGNEE